MNDSVAETLQQFGVSGTAAYWSRVKRLSGALAVTGGALLAGWVLVGDAIAGGLLGAVLTALFAGYTLLGVAGYAGSSRLAGADVEVTADE